MATETNEFLTFDSRRPTVRAALLVVIALTIIGAVFIVRWQTGRTLAELPATGTADARTLASIAVSYAPDDPLAHRFAAAVEKNTIASGNSTAALAEYERAVALAPHDYRLWLDLARAREQAGQTAGAEAAFRRAVELAPNYAQPRWLYGNYLLRANRQSEAFLEMRKAARLHTILRGQVIAAAWDALSENPTAVEAAVGSEPPVRAALGLFYAQKNRADDALRVWRGLSAAERREHQTIGARITDYLHFTENHRAALELRRELGIEPNAAVATIVNSGFESEITKPGAAFFQWDIAQLKNLEISIDQAGARQGNRCLQLNFTGYNDPTLAAISQLIVVEPSARYQLGFAVRTGDLKSAGAPLIEIADAKTSRVLGQSAPFATGTTDWRNVNVNFVAPANVESVLIRTARAGCAGNCPIVGTLWYDDFNLQRVGK